MMKKKKIIIVSTVGLMYDGITSVIMSYLQAMNLEKFDIYIVSTIKSDNTIKKTILDLGCHVIELPSRKTETLKYLLCLIKCIRTNQIEVLHAHGNSATLAIEMLAGWAVKKELRIRIIRSVSKYRQINGLDRCFIYSIRMHLPAVRMPENGCLGRGLLLF